MLSAIRCIGQHGSPQDTLGEQLERRDADT